MPTVAEVLQRGQSAQARGDAVEAERCFRLVLESLPKNATAWCCLGILFYEQGMLDDSDEAYLQSIESRSDFVSGLLFDGLSRAGLRGDGRGHDAR